MRINCTLILYYPKDVPPLSLTVSDLRIFRRAFSFYKQHVRVVPLIYTLYIRI
jgi:hypothetical protein